MKPEYRIELRVYDSERDETVDFEDTPISLYDDGRGSFGVAETCLARLERRFANKHAENLTDNYYSEPADDDEE
jgi:hypothetical protein